MGMWTASARRLVYGHGGEREKQRHVGAGSHTQLDDISYNTHNHETGANGLADLGKLLLVGCVKKQC